MASIVPENYRYRIVTVYLRNVFDCINREQLNQFAKFESHLDGGKISQERYSVLLNSRNIIFCYIYIVYLLQIDIVLWIYASDAVSHHF